MAQAYAEDELRARAHVNSSTRARALDVASVLFVALAVVLAVSRQAPPAAVGADAPAGEFSSGRARRHLEVIGQRPHPVGSLEHAAVREYVVGELSAMGLTTEVQRASVVAEAGPSYFSGATVQNIVARLKGTDSTGAVLLVGHYDTAPDSPGVSDDGSAVAAILETVRALKAGAALRNDVIVLLTDGEERGLLGARAFVGEHAWLRDVGLVLNLEARGSRGPAIMFETSGGNGWLIKEFADAAPRPVANSLAFEIYKLLPNDTDLTVFKKAGLPGLNFAYIDGRGHYHSALDSLDSLDERSLQHQGSYALALSRRFGNLSLAKTRTPDAIYFDVLGLDLLHYPQSWAVPLALVVTILFGVVLALGFRRRRLRASGVALGFLALLLSLVGASLLATLGWWLNSRLQGRLGGNTRDEFFYGELYLLSFIALAVAVTSTVHLLFRRRASVEELTAGGLLWWLVLALFSAFFLAGGSYLFTWPLLFGLAALACVPAAERRDAVSYGRFLLLCLCALPAILLLSPMIYQTYLALGVGWAGVLVWLPVLLLGLLTPHLGLVTARRRWLLPCVSALACAVLIAWANLAPDLDRERPKTNSVVYLMNADTGRAAWASYDATPDEWTGQFFGEQTQRGDLNEFFPSQRNQFLKSPAPATTLQAPALALLGDETRDGVRVVKVKVTSPQEVLMVFVPVEAGGELLGAAVNGKGVGAEAAPAAKAGERWTLHYSAPPAEGVELTFKVRPSQPLKVTVLGQSYGLPRDLGGALRPRPDYIIPTPFTNSDSTFVSRAYTL